MTFGEICVALENAGIQYTVNSAGGKNFIYVNPAIRISEADYPNGSEVYMRFYGLCDYYFIDDVVDMIKHRVRD